MTRLDRLCVLSALVWAGTVAPLSAAEPYLEFVRALRDRGYHDYAVLYLERLESRGDVPEDVRTVIPFEKAITLREGVADLKTAKAQKEQLDRAEGYLADFTREHPDHSLAARANMERARILRGKVRVEIRNAESAENAGAAEEHRQRARDYLAEARKSFQAAHDRYKADWEADWSRNPGPISADQKDRKAARTKKLNRYIQAQLDLARCTYYEAQTYPEDSEKYPELLTDASLEFEEIHSQYRSQIGGLYARMWQGKCFEEQDDIRRALGIYNELLDHPGQSDAMQTLKDKVRHFRLICLNHEKRQDYQLVINEATEWLNRHRYWGRSEVGRGIRWQRALAYETLGNQGDLSESERERSLKLALNDAQEIHRYPGEYKDVSLFMIQRIKAALGQEGTDPKDFDGAFGLARHRIKKVKDFDERLASAESEEERQQIRREKNVHLQETARILTLALNLADAQTELSAVNQARFFLAYVHYLRGRSYDAAVLGEFLARHFREESPQTARDAAYLAMTAYVEAYNRASGDQRDAEMRGIIRNCELITSNWGESEKATDARMTLGGIYEQLDQPAEAAGWYGDVPESSPQYAAAQLAAGQAYWRAYQSTALGAEEETVSGETLQRWQESAEDHLRTGIERQQATMPDEGAAGETLSRLIAAKVSLAQILVNRGQYAEAEEWLTQPPRAVLEAIAVEEESQRPETEGITSREFAGLAYQLLLRAYVGTQQIEKALQAMDRLERVAGGAEGEDVTAVYVQLGREIEKEIERLIALDQPQRLAEVRASFEQFLDALFQRRDQMRYGSLVWIAETYFNLGKGFRRDNQGQAETYIAKAAETYRDLLNRDRSDDSFVPAEREASVQLRLVNCLREQGEYEDALELARRVLQEKPTVLQAQFEAASVLQSWAESGQGDSYKKFLTAIRGLPADTDEQGDIWGWAQLARRLQLLTSAGTGGDDSTEKHFQARYNVSYCRYQYGLAQSSPSNREEALRNARQEIDAFSRVAGEVGERWKEKFGELYAQIQRDLHPGNPSFQPTPLDWPEVRPASTGAARASEGSETGESSGNGAESSAGPEQSADSSGGSAWPTFLGVVVAALAVTGGCVYFNRKPKRRRVSYGGGPPAFASPRKKTKSASSRKSSASSGKKTGRSRSEKTRSPSSSSSGGSTGRAARSKGRGGRSKSQSGARRKPQKRPEE